MKKLTIAGMILVMIIAGCKTKKTEEQEIGKLLERQAQLQESQSEAVDELQMIRDSLSDEKMTLIREREQKDLTIQRLEENQKALADSLREREQSAVASEKAGLQNRITAYEDSIQLVKGELSGLNNALDSIEQSIEFYALQEGRTEEALESGISEIDRRMTSRENRKQQEKKRAELLRKRMLVADKKIEAYEMERQMYVDERDNLLRINASEKEITPYRERIAAMDSIISLEQDNRQELESELGEIAEWIAATDSVMNELRAQIRLEHDKQAIIENFIASEKERLEKELEQLTSERSKLVDKQKQISRDLEGTEEQIASLDRRMELIRNREMSDILEQQAAIEETEADLAEEEIKLLEEKTGGETEGIDVTETGDDDLGMLSGMSGQLDSLNDLIQEEKAEIARTRKELAEQRAEAVRQRAKFGRTVGITSLVIVIGGIALLVLFYFLGRRIRKSKNA